jgi:sugar phosphate isomerase/epimerase
VPQRRRRGSTRGHGAAAGIHLGTQVPGLASYCPRAIYSHQVHLDDGREGGPTEQVSEARTGLDGHSYVDTVGGPGDVDLRAVVATLLQGGYDAWLSIDDEGAGDAKQELAESLRATQSRVQA